MGVQLVPADPPACPQALEAVRAADWVVLGPGSWFTSVLPHLLVPDLREALATTGARVLVNLNLAAQPGETTGFSPEQHLEVLAAHAPDLKLDVVLADRRSVPDPGVLRSVAASLGAELVLADVAAEDGADRHDPGRLAERVRRRDEPWQDPPMAMTAAVKDELSRLTVTKPCCRKAEVSVDAALRRRPAHRRRPHRRRGRAGHRGRGPPAASRDRRGLRPGQRGRRARTRAACAVATGTSCGW